jgi:hypothetical protein
LLLLAAGELTASVARMQVFAQYGQAGYAWDPKMANTPGPQVLCGER